jgi:hypothetical protein
MAHIERMKLQMLIEKLLASEVGSSSSRRQKPMSGKNEFPEGTERGKVLGKWIFRGKS